MLEVTSKPVDSFDTDQYHYALIPMKGYNPPRYNVQIYRLDGSGKVANSPFASFHIYRDQFNHWKEIAESYVKTQH